MKGNSPVFEVIDVANALSVNPETVRRWVRKGILKTHRKNGAGRNKITRSDLQEFLNAHPKYGKQSIELDSKKCSFCSSEVDGSICEEVGSKELGFLGLSLNVFAMADAGGKNAVLSFGLENMYSAAEEILEIPIKFCPVCGRML